MSTGMYTIEIRRLINAERARIFEAFSQPSALTRWFAPSAAIAIDTLDFEFVVGGRYRLRYSMPDGSRPVLGGVYELINPPGEFAFS